MKGLEMPFRKQFDQKNLKSINQSEIAVCGKKRNFCSNTV